MAEATPPEANLEDSTRPARQLAAWIVIALGASALLLGVLRWERGKTRARWSQVLVGSSREGERLFDAKGCVQCHGAHEVRGGGPDLGSGRSSALGSGDLVAAMWNHAPRMWELMREGDLAYPILSPEEMAHVLAYLDTVRYVDEPGDMARGQALFEAKGCARCHAVRGPGGRAAPDLSRGATAETPVAWARAMWNHPPLPDAPQARPRFEGSEMNDLRTYVRGGEAPSRHDRGLLDSDPGRGGEVFRAKGCTACHSIKDEAGRAGPELGPGRALPSSVARLAGSMWNHSPEMWRAMEAKGIRRPTLETEEMGALIAFLYGFRYAEPGGSPRVGDVLFSGRGCAACHGPRGEGSARGPRLRGRGKTFTSTVLAAELWRHGPSMYRRVRDVGLRWPELAEGDVGDLMAFLNTSPEGMR